MLIYNKIRNFVGIFSKKKKKTHCQFRKKVYFCTPFREERDGEKEADSSFSSCRYNSVGRVADL